MVVGFAFVPHHKTLFGQAKKQTELYFNFHLWSQLPGHLELKDEAACLRVFEILRIFYYFWPTNESIVYVTEAIPCINLSFDPCYGPEC